VKIEIAPMARAQIAELVEWWDVHRRAAPWLERDARRSGDVLLQNTDPAGKRGFGPSSIGDHRTVAKR
jgi:hypothetical protein